MSKKQFFLTLLLAVISGFLGGTLSVWLLLPPSVLAQDKPQKVIEAERFVVMDEDGRTRAILGVVENTAGLMLHDQNGKTRIFLSVEDSPRLQFSDQNGNSAVLLTADGEPILTLYNANGTVGSSLQPAALGFSGDKEEESGVLLSMSEDGPLLSFNDSQNQSRLVLSVVKDSPIISLYDANQTLRFILATQPIGSTGIRAASSLFLLDEEGNVVWSAP